MFGNAKARPIPPFLMNAPQADNKSRPPWQIRLTMGQVVLMWGIMAIVMVLVFFFGLYAGREQGLKLALEEQGTPTLRAPLTREPTGIGSAESKSEPATAINRDSTFDFSRAESVAAEAATAQQPPSSGLTGKSANELLGRVDSTSSKINEKKIDETIEPAFQEPASVKNPIVTAQVEKPTIELGQKRVQSPVLEDEDLENIAKPAKIEPPLAKKPNTREIAAQTKPEKPIAEVTRTAAVAHGWFIQLSAPSSRADADSMVRQVRGRGVDKLSVQEAKVKGLVHFRVLIGPFKSRAEAEAAQRAAAKKSSIASGAFIKSY